MSSYVKLRTPHGAGSSIHGESSCRLPHDVNERRQRVDSSCVKLLLRRYVLLHFIEDNIGKTLFKNRDCSCFIVMPKLRAGLGPSRRGRGVSQGVLHVHCRQEESPLSFPRPLFSQGNLPFRKYLSKWQNLVNGAYPPCSVHSTICLASWSISLNSQTCAWFP
jgi:hypothetical protein